MKKTIAFLIPLLIIFVGCEELCLDNLVVSSVQVTNIGSTSCDVSGAMDEVEKKCDFQAGFCYSTAPEPTVDNHRQPVDSISGTGTFSASLTGLSPGTKYYIRAYAKGEAKEVYGSVETFTTLTD